MKRLALFVVILLAAGVGLVWAFFSNGALSAYADGDMSRRDVLLPFILTMDAALLLFLVVSLLRGPILKVSDGAFYVLGLARRLKFPIADHKLYVALQKKDWVADALIMDAAGRPVYRLPRRVSRLLVDELAMPVGVKYEILRRRS